jgi:basic membrane lipoprotein Med (substrate-binding protein (PBP1-ABC) superfamily)
MRMTKILALAAAVLWGGTAGLAAQAKVTVGVVHLGSVKDAGYNQASHDAVLVLKKALPDVTVLEAENVPESADAERVIEQMINKGATIIFAHSFGYQDPVLNVAKKYPKVTFLHAGGFKDAPNFGTYWGNNFEGMYLAGIAAGAATKTGKLGFIIGFPIPNILASVNAFELGAKSVNPTVTTTLTIDNSFNDSVKEAASVNALADAGVDAVACFVDSPITVVKTAESRGLKSVGIWSASLKDFAPQGWLTGIAFNWGGVYIQEVKDVLAKTWKPGHLVGGIESPIVTLADYGPSVSADTKAKIEAAKAGIISGKLAVFTGPLKDNTGKEVMAAGKTGGADLLNVTNWLVEGVIGQVK